MQMSLDFRPRTQRLVTLAVDEQEFLRLALEQGKPLPDSFLLETRARRIGASRGEMAGMRSYDLARELADEAAILGFGIEAAETMQPTRVDWELADAIAKRESAERAAAFEEFLATTRHRK